MKKISLNTLLFMIPVLVSGFVFNDSYSAVRVKNSNYANAYKQLNEQRAQIGADAERNAVSNKLPISVADAELARKISSGDTDVETSVADLNACSAIYPNGNFEWASPDSGTKRGTDSTCVGVIDMYVVGAAPNGGNLLVARAKLGAGDSMRCNIDEFPQSGLLPDAEKVMFPADSAPTLDDVEQVMNQEQKQNMGWKILAGTLTAGVAMNAISNLDGDQTLGFGDGKGKKTFAAAGAGGAIMAASSLTGKVVGDGILNASVNAASGALAGNMLANGNSDYIEVRDCKDESGEIKKCVWGMLIKEGDELSANVFWSLKETTTKVCNNNNKNCVNKRLMNIVLDGVAGICSKENECGKEIEANGKLKDSWVETTCTDCLLRNATTTFYCINDGSEMKEGGCGDGTEKFIKVKSANEEGERIPALVVVGGGDKEIKDWDEWVNKNPEYKVYRRTYDNNIGSEIDEKNNVTFEPLKKDASDGGIIDLENKARLKSTATGAGVGGAIGAFSGVQGAKTEIQERYVSARREYDDSLLKFVCMTGERYLGEYNSYILIPNPQQNNQ